MPGIPHGSMSVEVGQIDGHVQGDAVVADAALDAQAQRADLARRGSVRVAPAAGMAVASGGGHARGGARLDQGGLERPDEGSDQQAAVVQSDDRIRHQLARTVIGDLPAALGPLDDDATGSELPIGGEDVRGIGLAAEGQNGGMLEEEQLVPDRAGGALVDEVLLEPVRLGVVDPAEPSSVQRRRATGWVPGGRIRPGFDQGRLHPRTIAGVRAWPVR